LLRGQEKLQAGQFAAALADFQAAKAIPDNLPSEGRGTGGHDAEFAYLIGAAYEGLGEPEKAKQMWQAAADSPRPGGRGRSRGAGGEFGAGRGIERYYQALAQQKLGHDDEAKAAFRELVKGASQRQTDPEESAPASGRRQSQRNRSAAAHYAAGLGHLGLGENDLARTEFRQALEAQPDHPGISANLRRLTPDR
jgi:tetratricopeptide (TPR) repeat protein